MKILMISLDKKLLDPSSAVARRMVEYGQNDELHILVPHLEKKELQLSQAVRVYATGGTKLVQLFRLLTIGSTVIKKNAIQEITVQDPFYCGLVGWMLKKRQHVPLEVQLHGDFFDGQYNKQWLADFTIKRADRVRVVGERVKHSLLKRGVDAQKIVVRSVPIDVEKIKQGQSTVDLHAVYPGYDRIFLAIGRLDPKKNIPWLISLFKEVTKQKKYLLLIVGNGTDEAIVRRDVGDGITLESWTADPYGYIKSADCVLFPSLSEGYGLVPMEANTLGTPVIMNDVGVANYELKPSEKVKIIPVSDREAWIRAILAI